MADPTDISETDASGAVIYPQPVADTVTAAVTPPRGAQTITLAYPLVAADGSEIASITLRRPKVRDLEVLGALAEESQIAQAVGIITALSGLTADQVADMDAADFEAANVAASAFFPQASAPATGAQ